MAKLVDINQIKDFIMSRCEDKVKAIAVQYISLLKNEAAVVNTEISVNRNSGSKEAYFPDDIFDYLVMSFTSDDAHMSVKISIDQKLDDYNKELLSHCLGNVKKKMFGRKE